MSVEQPHPAGGGAHEGQAALEPANDDGASKQSPVIVNNDVVKNPELSSVREWLSRFHDQWSQYLKVGALSSAALAILVTVLFIRPWEEPAEANGDNAAIAWNAAIERLGIQPLYPPQEDFFVGDVYINLEDPKREIDGSELQYPSNIYKGRGAKVGQVDLSKIIEKWAPKYRFEETEPKENQLVGKQHEAKVFEGVDIKAPVLSLVGFPGITVRKHVGTEAGIIGYLFGRRSGDTEEITIPYAESYGVSAVEATLALNDYCSDPMTSGFCSDRVARKLLAYTHGNGVNVTYDGDYVFPISISIISQVFLTRELNVTRYRGDSVQAAGTISSELAPSENSTAADAQDAESSRLSYGSMFSSRLRLLQVFARPVAFGFRRTSFTLPRSNPGTGDKK